MFRKGKKYRNSIIAVVVLSFYTAGLLLAVSAVLTVRTAQGAIAWSVSLVSFPFVAVPAYLVFGRSKFEGFADAYEERSDEIDHIYRQFRENLEPWHAVDDDRPSIYQGVRAFSNMDLTSGNSAELLIDGEATFDSILEGIERAREYVLFQFYMIHDDGLGRRVQQALIDRANAGVRVYVLYDEIGSSGLPKRYVGELEEAGVQVSSFRPTQGSRNRFQFNFRNHRKSDSALWPLYSSSRPAMFPGWRKESHTGFRDSSDPEKIVAPGQQFPGDAARQCHEIAFDCIDGSP